MEAPVQLRLSALTPKALLVRVAFANARLRSIVFNIQKFIVLIKMYSLCIFLATGA